MVREVQAWYTRFSIHHQRTARGAGIGVPCARKHVYIYAVAFSDSKSVKIGFLSQPKTRVYRESSWQ
jgi:hypothetical protein